ncbi:hypothetical protein CDD83_9825 [Cordyceps sp. RAO-2017]|nr:hypothetical protein CDD83_9825 [Cordyceps sp. RAO-2017]
MVDPKPLAGDLDSEDKSYHRSVDVSSSSRLLIWNPEQEGAKDNQISRFSYWFVSFEGSVHVAVQQSGIKAPGCYRWYAVELNSPIISVQEELDQRLPTVRRALASIQNSIKVWINAQCGFHVHVSPPRGALDVVVTRRMAALVLLTEKPLLLRLCHPCRQKSPYARPISTHSAIAVKVSASCEALPVSVPDMERIRKDRAKGKRARSSAEPVLFRILCAVLSETDGDSLARGLRAPTNNYGPWADGERCGIAVSRFGTLEFRYPEATFDVEFLSLWVDLARRILALAAAPDEQFGKTLFELYDMATSDVQLGWIHWLTSLGMAERADFCKKQISRYSGSLKDLNKRGVLPPMSSPADNDA